MDIAYILSKCDHTLLRPDATAREIMTLCDEAIRFKTATVCIPPCHVRGAVGYCGTAIPIATVIGFPNGYATAETKAFEAADAVKKGAAELDMVISLPLLKDGRRELLLEEINRVKDACGSRVLKVIIETCLLTEDEKKLMCEIVSMSGADFIKTSTGFAGGGATREDVALLRRYCDSRIRVKASGGISSFEDGRDFLALGADRLGTSRLVKLAIEAEKQAQNEEEEPLVP